MRTLKLNHASVVYHQRGTEVRAVNDVSFHVSEGETVSLVGESGSGKSSTARVIAGLQQVHSGSVEWLSDDVAPSAQVETGADYSFEDKPRVQMVFQHPDQSLNPSWKVKKSVAEPLSRLGVHRPDTVRELTARFLDRVGLGPEYLDRYPKDLSGGQAQRVAIARALVPGPHIVVLDEPTASLDQTVRSRLLTTLDELQRETGVGYLMVSHDMSSVRRISNRILVMYLGSIVEEGSTSQVLDGPVHPYTQALIRAVPPSDPRVAWQPGAFSVESSREFIDPALGAACPVPGGSCNEHQAGLNEISPGHKVACIRAV